MCYIICRHNDVIASSPRMQCNPCLVRLYPFQWRHNGHDGVSNHQPYDCLFNRLFRHRSKKTSKLRVTGLWEGNSPVTGEFPAQRTSNAENVSIWWRHHESRLVKPADNKETNQRVAGLPTSIKLSLMAAAQCASWMILLTEPGQHNCYWWLGAYLTPRHRQPPGWRRPFGACEEVYRGQIPPRISSNTWHRQEVQKGHIGLVFLQTRRI